MSFSSHFTNLTQKYFQTLALILCSTSGIKHSANIWIFEKVSTWRHWHEQTDVTSLILHAFIQMFICLSLFFFLTTSRSATKTWTWNFLSLCFYFFSSSQKCRASFMAHPAIISTIMIQIFKLFLTFAVLRISVNIWFCILNFFMK